MAVSNIEFHITPYFLFKHVLFFYLDLFLLCMCKNVHWFKRTFMISSNLTSNPAFIVLLLKVVYWDPKHTSN